jgi:hypothetical protein
MAAATHKLTHRTRRMLMSQSRHSDEVHNISRVALRPIHVNRLPEASSVRSRQYRAIQYRINYAYLYSMHRSQLLSMRIDAQFTN